MAGSELDMSEGVPIDLRELTEARVKLGRFGSGLPTRAAQTFLLDHARARQAVWSEMDRHKLGQSLGEFGFGTIEVESLAPDRSTYIRRPDLGRRLSAASAARLAGLERGADIVIMVGDGLSASAVEINAAALVRALAQRFRAAAFSMAPIVLAAQARVALADPVGEALGARVSVMLIGERPGLSAADSLGAYVTLEPTTGTPDSRRNCVSNIRIGGLAIEAAADAVLVLVLDMLRTGISGVGLKDAVAALPPESFGQQGRARTYPLSA